MDLEGNIPIQPLIVSEVDDSHAPTTELTNDTKRIVDHCPGAKNQRGRNLWRLTDREQDSIKRVALGFSDGTRSRAVIHRIE